MMWFGIGWMVFGVVYSVLFYVALRLAADPRYAKRMQWLVMDDPEERQ